MLTVCEKLFWLAKTIYYDNLLQFDQEDEILHDTRNVHFLEEGIKYNVIRFQTDVQKLCMSAGKTKQKCKRYSISRYKHKAKVSKILFCFYVFIFYSLYDVSKDF